MKLTKNPVFLHYYNIFMGILLFVVKYMFISLLLKMINVFSWPAKIMASPFNWECACEIMTAVQSIDSCFLCYEPLIKMIIVQCLRHIIIWNRCMSQGLNQYPMVTNVYWALHSVQWRNSRGWGGQSAPPDTSHWEISADLPGKERQEKKGKLRRKEGK